MESFYPFIAITTYTPDTQKVLIFMNSTHFLTALAYTLTLASFSSSLSFTRAPHRPMSSMNSLPNSLVEPSQRDTEYGTNIAKYLIDLHENKATFDFCGGMMFQLVLSDKLKNHLENVAAKGVSNPSQPHIFDKSKRRMFDLPNYSKNAEADNMQTFHGRELRQIPDAAGGMGFVLQLSLANDADPQGWTSAEIGEYDGWGHDVGRNWRKADIYEAEGFHGFNKRFGQKAFGLHHRFYLHLDSANRMWLSAEDGCEGTPSQVNGNPISRLFRF